MRHIALFCSLSPSVNMGALGVTTVNTNLTLGQGLGVEIILTFVLVFVIVATTEPNRTDFGSVSLKIGFTVAVMHLCGVSPANNIVKNEIANGDYNARFRFILILDIYKSII